MSVGPWQIAIIALVVLLLFGATRLGDIGKGLGEGIKNFKKGISETDPDEDELEKSADPTPKQLEQSEKAAAGEADSKVKKES
jgi:sec-independent protein translocase protein TatA